MKLSHGSNTIISTMNLEKCKPYKDSAKGFYYTAIKEQAYLMAKRVARIYGGDPYVNEFNFAENIYN